VLRYFRLIDARLYSAVLTLWAIIYDWFSRNFAICEWTRLTNRRFNSSANRNLCVVDELLKRLKCAARREIESSRRTMVCVLLSDVAKKKYKNPWRNIWRHVRPQLTSLNLQSFRALSQFILEIDWTKKKTW